MKLKNAIITIVIMTLILLGIGFEVNASGYSTHFYDTETHKWSIGDELGFTTSDWYKSYNIFCTDPGSATPTSIKVYNRMDTADGINYVWEATNGKYTEEQAAKILYIYSTLNDEIQAEISSRNNNWETPQQHAIWEVLGLQCKHNAGKNYAKEHAAEINQLLVDANAYYNFYKAKGFNYKTSIDTSRMQLNNNLLGPFTIDYKEYKAEYNGYTGTYGGVSTIELVKLEANGEISKSILCYDSAVEGIGKLSQPPSSNTDLYITGVYDISDYNAICVKYNNTYINGYIVLGNSLHSGQQSSMFGAGIKWPTQDIQTFTILDKLNFNLIKKDFSSGEKISNVQFQYSVEYFDESNRSIQLDDWKTVTTDSNGFTQISIANAKTRKVKVYINEIKTDRYYNLGYTIELSFENIDGKWTYIESKENYEKWATINDTQDKNGTMEFHAETVSPKLLAGTLYITNKQIPPDFWFELLKIDSQSEEALKNVKFTVMYEGIKAETYSTNENGEINIPVYVPNVKNRISVNVHENTPSGYKGLGYGLQLTFVKENDKWVCEKVAKLLNGTQNLETIYENGEMVLEGELVSFEESRDNTIRGTLLIKNEPENEDEIKLTLYKVDATNYSKELDGAVFRILVENGTINGKSSDSITVNGFKTVIIEPINKDEIVEITIKETTAPDGYKLASTTITLNFKYKKGNDGIGDWVMFNKSGSIADVSGSGTVRIKNQKKSNNGRRRWG